MVPRRSKSKKYSHRPIMMADLGEFTDEIILPGVKTIVEEEVRPLREEMRAGFREMRQEMRHGFGDVHRSIRELAGDIAELKVREEEQKHEERIRRVEEKVGIRAKA